MKLNKKFTTPVIALAALATVGAGAGAAALASADTASSNSTGVNQQSARPERAPGVHGKITAISGTTITITDERNSTTYTIDASGATVMKGSEGSAPTTSSVSALAVGDMIGAEGTVSGTSVTATKIMSGMMGGKGMGMGRGHGTVGVVTAVSGNTITITGENGTTYTVDASSAKVSKMVDVSVSDIQVGDRVGAEGTVSGNSVTATRIMTGLPERPADAPGAPAQQ